MNNPRIHHLNCGNLHAPPSPRACCHCLLIDDDNSLTLIDTGIGLLDIQEPEKRIGSEMIDIAGFQFEESDTAARQIESLGFSTSDVTDIILTHGDPDHTGGLADFPNAIVHISQEEHLQLESGNQRYRPIQFNHNPNWKTYPASNQLWFGLEARPVELEGNTEVLLIPLFGHTLGHCGVAVRVGEKWLLHVGDAYYLRVELDSDDDPVSQLAMIRADENQLRIESLEKLRNLYDKRSNEISMFGYHDTHELGAALKTTH